MERLAHTYSIVARDAKTGDLGAAVQSHYFATGSVVTWAEAGVGAIATQAFVYPDYGKLGLERLRAGKGTTESLAEMLAADVDRELRQVAMVDNTGQVAAHTGKLTIPEAGHLVGKQFSVQANMMLRTSVWPSMAAAYCAAGGDLADRMLAALEAAEAEGGDIRGRQSAALLIVAGTHSGQDLHDTIFDVRVDDATDPLGELRRMVGLARATHHMRGAYAALEHGDIDGVNREFGEAARLAGNNPEMRFWHSMALLTLGRADDGMALLREIAARDRNWVELALRLPATMAPRAPVATERILELARSLRIRD
jgi:uncharacterized Ntn-hydrolase superfamily protein